MKFFSTLFFSLCIASLTFAQSPTYLKSLHTIEPSNRTRIVAASDNGCYLFLLDSLTVYKFNSCGEFSWGIHYSFPGITTRGVDFIATREGGFAFLFFDYPATNYHGYIVNADAQGNISWCNSFLDVSYKEVPYTLIQDKSGNFYLYGNVTLTANLDVFNSLTKISNNGTVLWNKLYNHGGIWGGAILTSDNGFLLRTGNKFIKTDANGNEQWTSAVFSGLYHYNKAVEVADGYIFNGYNNNAGGGDTICFLKLGKNGQLLWGGKRNVPFVGEPLNLYPKYNGNFVFIHGKSLGGNYYYCWTELDKELNQVNSSAVNVITANSSFYPSSICYLKDSTAFIGGKFNYNDPAIIPHNAIIKTTKNHHFNCDTTFTFSYNLQVVLGDTLTTTVSSRNFQSTPIFVLAESLVDSCFSICSTEPLATLEIIGDTIACEGSKVLLSASGNMTYDLFEWSTGETSAQIEVQQAGKYWLKASNSCRGISASDTIEIKFSPFPKPAFINDSSICSEQAIVLDATVPGATYEWQDASTSPLFYVYSPGVYSVKINYLTCQKTFESTISDCEILVIPNVITPNNDALNSNLSPKEIRGIIAATMHIYNRWGQQIYTTNDIVNKPWNGKTVGKDCSDGVYYWTLNYANYLQQQKEMHGTVQLFLE